MQFIINSECGYYRITAETIEEAKKLYSIYVGGFDFDNYKDYEGSWYWIGDEDGFAIENHTENMTS